MATSERSARAGLPAFVLHRWDWSESSLIVELFVRPLGRIAVAARGAKRGNSELRAVLLPFQPIAISLTVPRRQRRTDSAEAEPREAEVQTLRGAEWLGGAPLLPPEALFSAYYLNELLLKTLARQDPHPTLFDCYAQAVAALATTALAASEQEAAVLRAFELRLLRETGVLPDLAHQTLDGQPLTAQRRYALRPEGGLVASAGDEALPASVWQALERALRDKGPNDDELHAACAAAGPALRASLRPTLQYHLVNPRLRTREVWRDVQRLAASVPGRG